MKLSMVPLHCLRVGDKVISYIKTPGVIKKIYITSIPLDLILTGDKLNKGANYKPDYEWIYIEYENGNTSNHPHYMYDAVEYNEEVRGYVD